MVLTLLLVLLQARVDKNLRDSVPIYETVKEAVDATGAKISIMFVPAKFFLGAAKDAH